MPGLGDRPQEVLELTRVVCEDARLGLRDWLAHLPRPCDHVLDPGRPRALAARFPSTSCSSSSRVPARLGRDRLEALPGCRGVADQDPSLFDGNTRLCQGCVEVPTLRCRRLGLLQSRGLIQLALELYRPSGLALTTLDASLFAEEDLLTTRGSALQLSFDFPRRLKVWAQRLGYGLPPSTWGLGRHLCPGPWKLLVYLERAVERQLRAR